MARFAFILFLSLAVLAVVNRADAARSGCQAFGKTYRDGESYTLSFGEFGRQEIHVCANGTWNTRFR